MSPFYCYRYWLRIKAFVMILSLWQLILHSLQKSVEKRPLDVEEVAAAAEAKIAKPNIAKVSILPYEMPLLKWTFKTAPLPTKFMIINRLDPWKFPTDLNGLHIKDDNYDPTDLNGLHN